MEDFSLSVNNILLKIKGNVFGDTEVFHGVRHHIAQFTANTKIMVYGCLAGEDNGRKIADIDLLLSEVLRTYPLNLNKRFEIDFQVIFSGQFKIGGLRICRLRLGY